MFKLKVSVSVPSVNKSLAKVIVNVVDTPTTKDPCRGTFMSLVDTPVIVYGIVVPLETFVVVSVNDAELPSLADADDLDRLYDGTGGAFALRITILLPEGNCAASITTVLCDNPLIVTVPSGTNNEALLVQSPYSGSSMDHPPGAGSVKNTLN